jgi:hypothetical protein
VIRLSRNLGISLALIAAALIGGTLIGSVMATDEVAPGPTGTTYCDTFLDTFADELGATRDEVVAAGQAAAQAAIDAAVEAGDLSAERAERLRTKVDEFDGVECDELRGFGFGHGERGPLQHGGFGLRGFGAITGLIDTLATELGMEPMELLPQLAEAGSLEALASDLGKDYDALKASVTDAVVATLDATDLAEDRQASILERVESWLDGGGQINGIGRFGRWGHGPSASDEVEQGG